MLRQWSALNKSGLNCWATAIAGAASMNSASAIGSERGENDFRIFMMRSVEWNAKSSSGAHSIESVSICHIVRCQKPDREGGPVLLSEPWLTRGLLTHQYQCYLVGDDETSHPEPIRSRT